MTSSTNAVRRDFSVDAGRLLSERCGRHKRWAGMLRHDCRHCLRDALAAAYEAGRADERASATPEGCYCDEEDFEDDPCTCCGAAKGEPCRHEVTP